MTIKEDLAMYQHKMFGELAEECNSTTFRAICKALVADPEHYRSLYKDLAIRQKDFRFDEVRTPSSDVSRRRSEEWLCRVLRENQDAIFADNDGWLGCVRHIVGSEIPVGDTEKGRSIDMIGVDCRGLPVIIEAKALRLEERSKNPIFTKTLLQALDYVQRMRKAWEGETFRKEFAGACPAGIVAEKEWGAVSIVLILPQTAATRAVEWESHEPEVVDLLQHLHQLDVSGVSVLRVPEVALLRAADTPLSMLLAASGVQWTSLERGGQAPRECARCGT